VLFRSTGATERSLGYGLWATVERGYLIAGTEQGLASVRKRLSAPASKDKAKPANVIQAWTKPYLWMGGNEQFLQSVPPELKDYVDLINVFQMPSCSRWSVSFDQASVGFESETSPVPGTPEVATCFKILARILGMAPVRSRFSRIHSAITIHRAMNGAGDYPASLNDLVEAGLVEGSELIDPAGRSKPHAESVNYRYSRPPASAEGHERYAILWQTEAWLPDGRRAVLFLDGTVEALTVQEFKTVESCVAQGKPVPLFR